MSAGTRLNLNDAVAHLSSCDPVIARLVVAHGRCTLRGERDLFAAMVGTVVSQQISTKAARSIQGRLVERFAATGVTPAALAKARTTTLRACGLSGPKQKTLKAVARAFLDGVIEPGRIRKMSNEEVAEILLPIHGIGPWSVDMVLMFALARPDVLPVGDFGLRAAVKKHYGFDVHPAADEVTRIAEPWRPYRTVATWYLWRSLGPVAGKE